MLASTILLLLPLPAAQEDSREQECEDPLHEIHTVLLREDDPVLTGHGPHHELVYRPVFSGTLYVWATGEELDPFLLVASADGTLLGEDDNGGGGRVACLELDVEPDRELIILVASSQPERAGSLVLHLVAAPETEKSRAAISGTRERLKKANGLRESGNLVGARALVAETTAELVACPGSKQSALIAAVLFELGRAAYYFADLETASLAWGRVVEHRQRTLPEDHSRLLLARGNLATTIRMLGDLKRAREIQEQVLAGFKRTLPEDHPSLLGARSKLAVTIRMLGDPERARELEEQVLAGFGRTLPEDHPLQLRARGNLAVTTRILGDLERARELEESVLGARERTLPKDHPDLLEARINLAATLFVLGHLGRARELEEQALAGFERTHPEDHPDLLTARGNLAVTMKTLGDLKRARELEEQVLAGFVRTLPGDHPLLLGARGNLAVTIRMLGDLECARELMVEVLAGCRRTLPEDHPLLLRARGNLAWTMKMLGELDRARELEEQVLAGCERTLPEDHPDLLAARSNLAGTLIQFGDHERARELEEQVLVVYERTFPEDHPDRLGATTNLAATLRILGDLGRAQMLEEEVLGASERTLPEDHPSLLAARGNLAVTIGQLGDLERARELQEQVLAGYERTFPEDHPNRLGASTNLALTLIDLGELERARELQEEVLKACERTLPEDHPDRLGASSNLALTLMDLGDLDRARELMVAQMSGMTLRLRVGLGLSPRQARALSASESSRLSGALFSSESQEAQSEQLGLLFGLVETRRHVVTAQWTARISQASGPGMEELRHRSAHARRVLHNRARSGPAEGQTAEEWRRGIFDMAEERDRALSALGSALREHGVLLEEIDAKALARELSPGEAAVGFLRYDRWRLKEEDRSIATGNDELLAMVLRSDGSVARVELGGTSRIEARIRAWRMALGKPLDADGRLELDRSPSEEQTGRELRRALLDPVFAAAGLPERGGTLYMCPDDLLHLVPLDALPLEKGGRVGDRHRILQEISFARLLLPRPPSGAEPSILLAGDADFDARLGKDAIARLASAPAPPAAGDSRGGFGEWDRLLGTKGEIEALGVLFKESTSVAPTILMREKFTKGALAEGVAGKRFVHLATHGWFAPESVRSLADFQPQDPMAPRFNATVRGFAPMTLCGLCLAGANLGKDERGGVPGLLTAEELASIDLSDCELAVLSACETNVGPHRAGEGILSLQTALHAAGARTVVTSLWKVPDKQTKELMIAFYTNLWVRVMGKAEALWEAKRTLRSLRYPVSAWAGWVMTGDPD